MSEKRFEFYSDDYLIGVLDTVTGKTLNHFATIDKLNEQQATITHLEKVNGKNFAKRRLLEKDNLVLRNENEQLKSLVNACEYGQKNLMKEMENSDEALDKIWEIMKELYGSD